MTTENKLQLIRMSDVKLQSVDWLWYPYIPFGKITMIQGDPGEGKTTLALRLAAACSTGTALLGMEAREPFTVLYQTAEDGLGDTIKPRLIDAGADENMIFCIDESNHCLSLLDKRIEDAIVQTGAKLMILDPVQGYLGDKVDMNRANEIRSVLKRFPLSQKGQAAPSYSSVILTKRRDRTAATAGSAQSISEPPQEVCCSSADLKKNLMCVSLCMTNLHLRLKEIRLQSRLVQTQASHGSKVTVI